MGVWADDVAESGRVAGLRKGSTCGVLPSNGETRVPPSWLCFATDGWEGPVSSLLWKCAHRSEPGMERKWVVFGKPVEGYRFSVPLLAVKTRTEVDHVWIENIQ